MQSQLLKYLDYLIHPDVFSDLEGLVKVRGLVGLALIYVVASSLVAALSENSGVLLTILPLATIFMIAVGRVTGKYNLISYTVFGLLTAAMIQFIHEAQSLHVTTVFWTPILIWASVFSAGPFLGGFITFTMATAMFLIFNLEIISSLNPLQIPTEQAYLHEVYVGLGVAYVFSILFHRTTHSLVGIAVHEREALLQQKEKTIEASKLSALGEMAGGIAHEINNPLMIIRGNAEVIQKGENEHNQVQERTERIIRTVDRIEEIISSMQKLSDRHQHNKFEYTDLVTIIQESLIYFQEKIRSLGIELEVSKPTSIPVYCNTSQVGQILINLLNNACDAILEAHEHEAWIRIEARIHHEKAVVLVSNSGPKINEDLVNDIMRPFFTTKDFGKGTGLGLSVSKKIAQQHGGDLLLEFEKPNTTFELRLPLRKAEVGSYSEVS